jgi:PTH1 family peptidyl-tRNA hydrolase
MYVIAGLGNPGSKYANTKHNLGFMAVDLLAERHGIRVSKLKHKALAGEGFVAGKKVLFLKPQTYMNESGQSVRDAVNYYGVSMDELFVIYDDVDIPAGSLRIRKKGSAGTHNGMKNIIYLLEDDSFPRFRIGIGSELGRVPLRDFVLAGFSAEDRDKVREAVVRCADAVETALSGGVDAAMLKYNISVRKKKESGEKEDGENGGIDGDGA